MGGEWGVGSALAMETVPARARGFVSGLLQAGYPSGYLLASVVFGLFYPYLGWRGMFFTGVLPALLVWYIRRSVPESPAWQRMQNRARPNFFQIMAKNWKLSIYAIVLMTAFNFFSHGTQDFYPTFLREQRNFDAHTVSLIAVIYNVGAILGGIIFGTLSEKIGRRWAIFTAALLALPILPLWAFSTSALALAIGAFLMQVAVQGAWGAIPAHLNELSPHAIRATFPGLVYQCGNLFAAISAPLQTSLAAHHGGDYAMALAIVAGVVAVVISVLILFSREHRGVDITKVHDV
jgi:SHS family lactate transporter-like MFS transporter